MSPTNFTSTWHPCTSVYTLSTNWSEITTFHEPVGSPSGAGVDQYRVGDLWCTHRTAHPCGRPCVGKASCPKETKNEAKRSHLTTRNAPKRPKTAQFPHRCPQNDHFWPLNALGWPCFWFLLARMPSPYTDFDSYVQFHVCTGDRQHSAHQPSMTSYLLGLPTGSWTKT